MGLFKNLLGTIVDEVQKRNKDNTKVKTADTRVFEDVKAKLENVDREEKGRSRADLYKDFMDKIGQAKQENEASQEIETADNSIFDDFVQEIGKLESKVESQSAGQAPVIDFKTSAPSNSPNVIEQAHTNSSGGSLQMRVNPAMGSAKTEIYIPELSVLNVLRYSDNKVILDGAESRFALVDYNGKQGWILEKYLNFN